MSARPSSFIAELRRRHVVKVAVAYVIAAWLLLQLGSILFPAFDAPAWTTRVLFGFLVLCFPIAVIVAWAFEATPEGIRRTEPAHVDAARSPETHRRIGAYLNAAIIVVLLAAVGVLGWRLSLRPANVVPRTASAAQTAPVASTIPSKSIAVLPFENLSADKNNDYFVAGMQDLILTKLADIGGLKVIARTSTAKYASHPDDLRTIGRELGVATILEGSVQKQGKQVLINVQLIDTKTDGHIWAQAYPRTLDNVFGVEGEVAEKIAAALKAKLSPAENARLAAVPTQNTAAYDLFLRAEYQANQGNINYATANFKAAIPLYRQAIDQDPGFALAYARVSWVESTLAWFGGGGMNVKQLTEQARSDAERALKLAPDLAASQLALGYSDYYGRGDYDAALKAFAAALALQPNDADILAARGYVERRQGRIDAAIASLQQAFALDPRNSALAFELGSSFTIADHFAEAERWFRRALALDPHNLNAKSKLAQTILLASGNVPRALAAAQGDDPALKLQRVTMLTYQRKYREALALLDTVPDSLDNFQNANVPKALQQAELYRLMGDMGHARPLYTQALPRIRAQLSRIRGINQAFVWQNLAIAELGLGHTAQGLDAIAKTHAIVDKDNDWVYGPELMEFSASLYAEAGRPDLAVPLLARALASPSIGDSYSPVLLWLDPAWDPIRHDPGFQALLKKYASHRPPDAAGGVD